MTPDQLTVERAVMFRRQCAKVAGEMHKLWLMREWGNAEANVELRGAHETLKAMLNETKLADYLNKSEAA